MSIIKFDKKLINQAEVARRLEISKSYVSMLLKGDRKNTEMLNKINQIVKESLESKAA
ncbi:MAG: helix-turn-helix domain-containing protein [Melioribacteraceae bacterium]|nr:helix-turn-helix domain-containing protein [Melioribacteraceae bacterium]MCF8265843.1 helix-turn-helix domain-containing protein [Melioribacteraceae bacterium]MCF8414539.1 helix-turn-helix domain-containing protein [Melioribacteraceae bacterium]